MKTVIVTGATGFIGYHLTKRLSSLGFKVYAIIRPNSNNKHRLENLPQIEVVDLDMAEIAKLPSIFKGKCDYFFHVAWEGERNDFTMQYKNNKYC